MAYEFEVIIHPAGQLDVDDAGYWTEVVSLPSCYSQGQSEEEAIANTRKAIVRWLIQQKVQQLSENKEKGDMRLQVNINRAI